MLYIMLFNHYHDIIFAQLEGSDAAPDDPVHLKRRVGLFSGVALIVGTMIGKFPFLL